MVTGNVSVFQKTGDTRGLLCFTLELNWQFIKFKSVKKYCHKALKGKKSGVWRMYKQFEPNSKQFKMKSSIQLNKTSNFICQSGWFIASNANTNCNIFVEFTVWTSFIYRRGWDFWKKTGILNIIENETWCQENCSGPTLIFRFPLKFRFNL